MLVSRATGARGIPADGYATDPSISEDGLRVAFASTASNLSEAKPDGIAGVFVRDLARNTTTLLSTHARAPRRGRHPGGLPGRGRLWRSPLAFGAAGFFLFRRRRPFSPA